MRDDAAAALNTDEDCHARFSYGLAAKMRRIIERGELTRG